ncbi:cation:proton antiporter [Ramlibacter solisilvae]|uniref:Sodium:proton antiporter n=1 Tax=Ramlibacter tataouinensis TaxID=94132 RepID=A0A127JWU5_9BURK|nr:YbaL family putative K(+) efflux transporter [Ramlibacter tataouinensis]AMO24476.1 sodium:proton antiporter [Ramlibacter tataouinensis]
MHDELPLITTIAAGLSLALVFGFLAARLRMPALVGYLLAGIVIGPFTPGFVADTHLASQLAEIGIMLLMFGVGLHFSLGDLLAVRRIAVPGAIVQILAACAMGAGMAVMWGWDLAAALVFGLSLSVASTVVLLRALENLGLLDSFNGRVAVGWLVVEDLAMVLVLVLLPALAGALTGQGADGSTLMRDLGKTLLLVGLFLVLMLVVGRRFFPWLLWQVQKIGSRELFTLCVVAAAVSIAYGATKIFGVSFALGAFFAGMVLRESQFSHRAAEETLPLRDAFAVLFFVSVGMLFDPAVIVDHPLRVLAVVGVIMLGKSIAAAVLVLLLRYPLHTALTVSASLAQIGEFSFILVSLGSSLGLMPPEARSLVVAGALFSIALNPLVFKAIRPLQDWLLARSQLARDLAARDDPLAELPMSTDPKFLSRQVVLVGYGSVGRKVAAALGQAGLPYVVADQNRDLVEKLRAEGVPAVCGDATRPEVLVQAHIARARLLVIAMRDTTGVRQMAAHARLLNSQVEIIVRSHNEEEARRLEKELAGRVFVGEHELALAMSHYVVERCRA